MGSNDIRRRDLLLAGATAFASGCSLSPQPVAVRRTELAAPAVRVGDQIGPVQKGNGLNVIFVVADTFRADYLGCYGNPWIKTPNLDRLAKRSVLFTECYAESLPTLPARRVLLTGRRAAPLHLYPQQSDSVQLPGWHPLFYDDITLPEWLLAAGYTTGYVTDVPHVQKPGKNFHRGFSAFHFIRGNEADRYMSGPKDVPIARYSMTPDKPGNLRQYLMNRRNWKTENDTFAAQVMQDAASWLRDNKDNQPFFLYVDCFDPHEPWDPPDRYAQLYAPGGAGPKLITPPNVTDRLSKQQIEQIRSLYAGEVSLVDAWAGRLLDQVNRLGLSRNTVIVFTSDHGTMLGEQGQIHKAPERVRGQVTRVPLLIAEPSGAHAGRKIASFVQHTDIAPTLLSMLNVALPARATGENAWPLVTGEKASLRDTVVVQYGYYAAARTAEWSYVFSLNPRRTGSDAEELYDLRSDPQELKNVASQNHSAVRREMRAQIRRYMAAGEDMTNGSFGPAAEVL